MRRALLALCLVALAAPAHAAPMARSLVERSTLTLGEGIEWVVVLENAGTTVPEPQFENLDWARVQATGSSRNLSMVNGNFSSSVSYTFLLVPVRVGRHIIPSVTFQIGRTVVRSSPLTIDVVPAAPGLSSGSSGGGARLRLVITVDRNHAVVGEPIRMTVRFFQGVRLRSDPDYRAPDVPGFWTEPPAVPRSYYANDASGRWLVSETRTFLYPTVSGRLRIGSARMECELAGDEDDGGASGLSGGGTAGQTIEIQSDPITVDVAPAPAQGQPGGYQGAVGDFGLTVHPERTRVRADETMNLTLRVAGTGNLRLAPIPQWPTLDDFQVYSKSSDDSLNLDGDWPSGAKIITYSLLPRRQGTLHLPSLRYVTYMPGQGYRTLESGALAIQVDPPIAGVTGVRALQPLEVPRGLYRPPQPWPGWLAALLGLGVALLSSARLARGRAESHEVRAERAVSHARGALGKARHGKDPEKFYLEAERVLESESLAELRGAAGQEEEGARKTLLARARAARYSPGGAAAELEGFAGMLDRHLETLLARVRARKRGSRVPGLVFGLALVTVAIGLAYGIWRSVHGEAGEDAVAVWREAAKEIAQGDAVPAEDKLTALWAGGVRGGTLAAQTALAALRERQLGEGALWIERGRREAPRDSFVRSVRRVLDEETSLPGHPEGLGTLVTWWELLLLAGALWLFASATWSWQVWHGRTKAPLGRSLVIALGGLAIVVVVAAAGVWRSGFAGHASVVLDPVSLRESPGGHEELDLEPGRLLEVKGARGDWRLVELGGGLRGWVQAAALGQVEIPVSARPVRVSYRR
ncbi:MAG TPA: BatD family protein [Candidatus Eisenbacteria bacterium]|nr:BatD family protein [Candidatus Eisenbacteria bacterium]